MNTLEELLNESIGESQGIVLRYIPKTTVAIYAGRHFENKPNQELIYDEKEGCSMMRQTKVNTTYGGKWLAQRVSDSGSTTRWSKQYFVVADTPEEAVRLLLEREGV